MKQAIDDFTKLPAFNPRMYEAIIRISRDSFETLGEYLTPSEVKRLAMRDSLVGVISAMFAERTYYAQPEDIPEPFMLETMADVPTEIGFGDNWVVDAKGRKSEIAPADLKPEYFWKWLMIRAQDDALEWLSSMSGVVVKRQTAELSFDKIPLGAPSSDASFDDSPLMVAVSEKVSQDAYDNAQQLEDRQKALNDARLTMTPTELLAFDFYLTRCVGFEREI